MLLRTVLVACIFIVIGILSSEVRGWRAGSKRVTVFQKILRISSASLMITILAMVLVGDRWLYARGGPLAVMAYWAVCFILAVILLIIALFDLREVGLTYRRERKYMLHRLSGRSDRDDDA